MSTFVPGLSCLGPFCGSRAWLCAGGVDPDENLELKLDIHEFRLDIELCFGLGEVPFFGALIGIGFDGVGSFTSPVLSEVVGFLACGGCCGSGECGCCFAA